MNTETAIEFLNFLTSEGVLYFGLQDLRLWTKKQETDDALRKSLKRHTKIGLFKKVWENIYINGLNNPYDNDAFSHYQLSSALRPREYTWESLESRLSQLGVISQIPNRLTFMTTGKSGVVETILGTFEFSHVPDEYLPDIRLFSETGILHATAKQAWKDLQYINRNLDLVDMERLEEAIEEEEKESALWSRK